jgi:hypothetical protein
MSKLFLFITLRFYLRYIIFSIVTTLLVIGSLDANIQKITPWLLGINFTIAIFSINFTFFGHQLSKYKAIYSKITKRQWLNIITLMVLPFLPLICFLIVPEYFGNIALWILPILVLSSADNAELTAKNLSPNEFIKNNINDSGISRYLALLSKEVKKEADEHQVYLDNRKKFQLPIHAYDFEPTILGLEPNDIWDSITVITNLSVENNDYPVFRQSLSAILKLVIVFYSFKYEGKETYRVDSGIRTIARKRFRSIITYIVDSDKNGIFLQSLSSELCSFLMKEETLNQPCSDMTRAIASDSVWVGKKMLESNSVVEPIKILNTIHRVIEISIYRLENESSPTAMGQLDKHNITIYAYDIKALGVTALNNGNSHFAYRCMESLSYLGCNAAKLKSKQTVVAVFESIVQIGRLARNLKIGCFWSRCLIPAESHAEEFMGHILTWLIHNIDSAGNFFMREYAEQAYSRLRGVKCVIKQKSNCNPCFWIEELENDGKKISHIEYESGMYGYGGQSDYSDFSNLKEYVLHGIGSESTTRIFHSTPIPLNLDFDDSTES